MKKRIFSLVFIFVLLISAMVLAFSVQRTYAKYSSASNVTQSVTLEYEAHSGTSFTVQQYTNTQHKKTWSCCGYVVYESHAYSSDSDFECDCGYVRHEHTYTLVSKVDPTCTSEGTEAHYVCDGTNGCGKLFDATTRAEVTADSLTIAKKAHSYTVAGNDTTHHFNKCSGCGAIDESSKVAHSAADNTYYSDESNHWRKCSCGYNVEVTAHTAVPGGTEEIHEKCSVCSRTLKDGKYHDKNSSTPKQDATCTEMGTTTYTCSCGYVYDLPDIAAKGHSYTKETAEDEYLKSEATCQSAAIYYKSCVRCGSSSKNQTGEDTFTYGDAIAHIASAWTRLDDNRHYQYCTRSGCGATVATGNHNQDTDGGTSAIHKKCSVCGATTSTSHSYTDKVKTAATCTATGKMTHTCSCGYSYESDISMIPHTSAYGGTAQVHTKCSVCGNTLSSTHSYSSNVSINPTCTAMGTTKYSCSCGYSYTSENINALGHQTSTSWASVDGTTHRKYCTRENCGATIETGTHSGSYSSNSSQHWKDCSACGYRMDAAKNHSGNYSSNSTQHWKDCSTCSYRMVNVTSHTSTHNRGVGGTGNVSCSVCSKSITPGIFYDPDELVSGPNCSVAGTFMSNVSATDATRGPWRLFKVCEGGCGLETNEPTKLNGAHGNFINIQNVKRYMVIEYGSTDSPAIAYGNKFAFQWNTGGGINTNYLTFDQNVFLSGLMTEILDIGASSTYLWLYLWVNANFMHVANIAFFDTAAEAEAYQQMLTTTTDYSVTSGGYATLNG